MVDLAPPVGVVTLASPVGVVNLPPAVGVVNLPPAVGVVDLALPVGEVDLAPPVDVVGKNMKFKATFGVRLILGCDFCLSGSVCYGNARAQFALEIRVLCNW